nr:type 2 lanthipeptide synthetase LanM family protein [Paenibacillus apiarius]
MTSHASNDLALSLSIKERVTILKKEFDHERIQDGKTDNVFNWRARKSLVSDAAFQEKLFYENFSLEDFHIGIKTLSEPEKEQLSKHATAQVWYQQFLELYYNYKEYEKCNRVKNTGDFATALKWFLVWAKEKIDEFNASYSAITLSETCLTMLMEEFYESLVYIASKSFINDLHACKEQGLLEGDTPEQRFGSYVRLRFVNPEKMMGFFNEYPVLTKLLTNRTRFFVANIQAYLRHLNDNWEEIRKKFNFTSLRMPITSIKMGAGDSHQKGKSVILFELDHVEKLVYKPKNLIVAERYNELLEWLNAEGGFDLYINKGFYTNDFGIEPFLDYKECEREEDFEQFYHGFGQLAGIAYLLCGCDFHYENLVAHGRYPCLVDIETLFHHDPQLNFGDEAFVKAKSIMLDSVLSSGLIPFISYSERSENGEGVQFSALSGDSQKLPYRVLKVSNMNTDEIAFEYQEHTIEGAHNIPAWNGQKANFQKYTENIIEGFRQVCSFFANNKQEILGERGKLSVFKDVIVRHVLKGTQRYGDLLNFSYHPSCTKDAVEREKLFENQWGYPYFNKKVVIYEIEDLTNGDIPVFFSKADSTELITSAGETIPNFYAYSGYEKSVNRIRALDDNELDRQISYLKVSFGTYSNQSHLLERPAYNPQTANNRNLESEFLLHESMSIADKLLDEAIYSDNRQTISWLDIVLQKNGSWAVSPLQGDLYDGLSGLLLYFYSLYKVSGDDKYKEAYKQIEESVLKFVVREAGFSSFSGRGALLYPLLIMYKNEGEEVYRELAEGIGTFLISSMSDAFEQDWLNGYAGNLANIVNLFKLTGDSTMKQQAEAIGDRINLDNLKLGGYAHGYAGIAVAFCRLSEISDRSAEFLSKAREALRRDNMLFDKEQVGWLDKRSAQPKIAHQWCHGSTGVGLSRIQLKRYFGKTPEIMNDLAYCYNNLIQSDKDDDCLCHGNFGDIEFLHQYYLYVDPSLEVYENLKRKIVASLSFKEIHGDYKVRSLPGFRSVGLFTGLAGIGYQYLRLYQVGVTPDVLTFEM